MVGALTLTERAEKIKRYLEKRKRRVWARNRISYLCRKRVAENRLRDKGRFIKEKKRNAMLESDRALF